LATPTFTEVVQMAEEPAARAEASVNAYRAALEERKWDAATAEAPLPARVGRFEVRARLGSGAFGTVYRAFDPDLQRDVAVKVPRDGTLANSQAAQRFLCEARVAAGLRHPHIVPVYEVGQDGSRPYIVSAFIAGQTLSRANAAVRPFDCRQAARVVAELAEALEYAHWQGIVHRDVKPANVMLDTAGRAYLMDFGLAHLQESEAGPTGQPRLGSVLGTPAYMAPEQAEGWTGQALPASDQYALGVVLYELLCGQTPFGGPPDVVLYNAVHADIPPPHGVRPDVPAALERICLQALARRPEQRYPSCRDLAEALRHWLAQESVPAQPAAPVADQPPAPDWLADVAQAEQSLRRPTAAAAPPTRVAWAHQAAPAPVTGADRPAQLLPGHTAGWAWATAGAAGCLLVLAAVLVVSRLGGPRNGPIAPPTPSKGTDGDETHRNSGGKDGEQASGKDAGKDSEGDKGGAKSEPPGEGQQSAGKSGGTDGDKAVALPTVDIVKSEPAQPVAGDDLVVQLRGTDPDDGALSYWFRTGDQEDWRAAPDGRVVLAKLAAGRLRLQVRASNAQGRSSLTVPRAWDVKAAKPALPPPEAPGRLGAETLTLQVLLDRLQTDTNPDVRAAAEKALRERLPTLTRADVPRLREGLKSHNLQVRGYCAEAVAKLGREGQEAAPELARALNDTDKEVRRHAAAALVAVGPGTVAVVPTLVQILQEGDGDASHLAAVVLKALGPGAKAAVPDLVPLLRDARLCKGVIQVLGKIGQDAVPALKQALRKEDLRSGAIQALELVGPAAEGAVPELLDCLEDEDRGVWEAALGTLKAIGKAAVPKLLKALQSDREEVRRGAARTLGNVADNTKEVIKALQDLKDEHPRGKESSAATEALRKIQNK
jgi:HEAT repeat protein